jgi:VanZ family protein
MWHWGPAIAVMAIIFLASATPGSELPKFGAWDLTAKKGGHMFGYALLSAAYLHAISRGGGAKRRQYILAVLLATLYAATDEFHQLYIPGRTASPMDVGVDAIGSLIGLGLWCLLRTRAARAKKSSAG